MKFNKNNGLNQNTFKGLTSAAKNIGNVIGATGEVASNVAGGAGNLLGKTIGGAGRLVGGGLKGLGGLLSGVGGEFKRGYQSGAHGYDVPEGLEGSYTPEQYKQLMAQRQRDFDSDNPGYDDEEEWDLDPMSGTETPLNASQERLSEEFGISNESDSGSGYGPDAKMFDVKRLMDNQTGIGAYQQLFKDLKNKKADNGIATTEWEEPGYQNWNTMENASIVGPTGELEGNKSDSKVGNRPGSGVFAPYNPRYDGEFMSQFDDGGFDRQLLNQKRQKSLEENEEEMSNMDRLLGAFGKIRGGQQ